MIFKTYIQLTQFAGKQQRRREESKQEDDGADDRKRGDVDGIVKGQASPWDGLAG